MYLNHLIGFFDTWGLWIVAGSVLLTLTGIAATPYMISHIPEDYFTHHGRHRKNKDARHPLLRLTLVSLKNILGAALLVAGVIMLFGPGPGLMTVLIALVIMNFPGKYRLECWIISRQPVFQQVNAMRQKRGLAPLESIGGPDFSRPVCRRRRGNSDLP